MASLLQLRDEAFQESEQAHNRLRHELAVFRNEGYEEGTRVGASYALVEESLMPQIQIGCLRLVPAFREQIARINVEPDGDDPTVQEVLFSEGIANWNKMYEEVDDEGGRMRSNIYWNLVCGNALSKVRWDPVKKLVRAESINPTSFAPDPACTQSNFSDAGYVVHRNFHNRAYMRKHYPDWSPPALAWSESSRASSRHPDSRHRVDEIWMHRDVAEDCGVRVNDTKREIILVKLIDDTLYKAQGSPYWFPGFPFAHWRNFVDLLAEGKPHGFWGYGYGTLAWPQQKMLDEFISNFILILRNLGIGRFIAKDGAIDEDQISPLQGAILRMNEGFDIGDLQHLPPEIVPPVLIEFIQFISGIMTDMMPSLSSVFAGEAPFAGASGRAVESLRFANFNQLSDNIREMNEFRLRRMRIKVAVLQQFARRPLRPHLWRGGLDMQDPFPEEARHVGYRLSMPDLTALPNTPAGKLQMLQVLGSLGLQPKDPLDILGLTKGYGWTSEDFTMVVPPFAGGQVDEEVLSGQEMAMRAER